MQASHTVETTPRPGDMDMYEQAQKWLLETDPRAQQLKVRAVGGASPAFLRTPPKLVDVASRSSCSVHFREQRWGATWTQLS
jgi:hypothetical protein